MAVVALIVILAVLIFLEKRGKIRLANMGASVFMIISVSVICGLFVAEFIKTSIALVSNVMGFDSKDTEFLNPMFEEMSNTAIVVNFVLLLTLIIPFVIGTIYIIQAMVRKPVLRQADETDKSYSLRCSARSLTLGIISAVWFFVCLAVMIALSIPYLSLFIKSLYVFHPVVLIFIFIFTGGLGVFVLPGMFVVMNSTLFEIIFTFLPVATAFYVFSVILGISACVRARGAGVITTGKAFVYGVLSLMSGWNFIPYAVLRHKVNKQIV